MDPRDLLEKRIVKIMNELEDLKPGTPEHQKATEDLDRLYEVMIKDDKARSEMKLAEEKLNDEQMYRVEDRADELRKEKIANVFKGIGLGMTAIGGVATYVFNWTWHNRGLEFEKTGAFTSRVSQFVKNFNLMLKR